MNLIKTITVTQPVDVYEYNGKIYETYEEAQGAEEKAREQADPVYRYSKTYGYDQLVREAGGLDKVGFFTIHDEGSVDFSSGAGPRLLKVCHGTLRNVIIEAFNTKGFVGWGPSRIALLSVVEV